MCFQPQIITDNRKGLHQIVEASTGSSFFGAAVNQHDVINGTEQDHRHHKHHHTAANKSNM